MGVEEERGWTDHMLGVFFKKLSKYAHILAWFLQLQSLILVLHSCELRSRQIPPVLFFS